MREQKINVIFYFYFSRVIEIYICINNFFQKDFNPGNEKKKQYDGNIR